MQIESQSYSDFCDKVVDIVKKSDYSSLLSILYEIFATKGFVISRGDYDNYDDEIEICIIINVLFKIITQNPYNIEELKDLYDLYSKCIKFEPRFLVAFKELIDLVEMEIDKIFGKIKPQKIFQKDNMCDFVFRVHQIIEKYKPNNVCSCASVNFYKKFIKQINNIRDTLFWSSFFNFEWYYDYFPNILKMIVLERKNEDFNKLKEVQKCCIRESEESKLMSEFIELVKEKLYVKYWNIGYEDSLIQEKYVDRGVMTCLLGFIHLIPQLEPDADILDIDILTYERD